MAKPEWAGTVRSVLPAGVVDREDHCVIVTSAWVSTGLSILITELWVDEAPRPVNQ